MPEPHNLDDSSSGDHATASESTPLIHSQPTSRTSRSSSPSERHPRQNGSRKLDDDEPNQTVSRKRAVAIMLSVYVLIFLQASNMSGMTMAQSTIAADLDAYEDAMWFTSSYLIAMSSCGPLAGRLASIFSPRLIILVTSVFFVVGGLVTSQAQSFGVFILGRVLSGTGGAGMMVLAMILVLELTSKKTRGLYVGLVNAGFTTGVSLGAVVFGALIPVTGWRFLFWIQSPFSAVAGLGVYFSLPKTLNSEKRGKDVSLLAKVKNIDYLGAVLLTSTLVLFLVGLSGGAIQVLPIILSLVTLVLFVATEYKFASDPIIPLSVLSSRGALLSCFSQLGLMASRWTILFYAPITALAVFGFSPASSGSMLIPTNLGFGVGGLMVGWLHVKRAGSFWLPCIVSVILFGLSLILVSFVSSPSAQTWVYVLVVFVNGLCTGAALNYTLAHLLHLTPPSTHYVATSLLGTFRGFAGSFGSAIGGGVFARTLRSLLQKDYATLDHTSPDKLSPERLELVKRLIGSPALVYGGDLTVMERQIAVQGYAGALKTLFQAACVLVLVVLVLQAATGWKGPQNEIEDEEEVRRAEREADPEMEA